MDIDGETPIKCAEDYGHFNVSKAIKDAISEERKRFELCKYLKALPFFDPS